MSDPRPPDGLVPDRPQPIRSSQPRPPDDEVVRCDRCAAEMFRMHAVWRCPQCGFKTDCCGW